MDDASASFQLFHRPNRLEVALEIGPTSSLVRKTSLVRSLKAMKLKKSNAYTKLRLLRPKLDSQRRVVLRVDAEAASGELHGLEKLDVRVRRINLQALVCHEIKQKQAWKSEIELT